MVLFKAPLPRGEPVRLVFGYESEAINYLPGDSWYPTGTDGFLDKHTANFKITARKKDDVRAMGELIEEREEGDVKIWTYAVREPARMVTFSFAERFHEETLEIDGVPKIIAFASSSGSSIKNKTYNVAADVANSINFFQQIFQSPLAVERLYATSIYAGHGQSFDGFLHLAEADFENQQRLMISSNEAVFVDTFRAHEAAHQWWGHKVAWKSYRDQWLSEGFAEYSALMFVQATAADGAEQYGQWIEGMSEALARAENESRARFGPISLGYRAATSTDQGGYYMQSYIKGALVLHMLRGVLRSVTKSDEAFFTILRDFLAVHDGGAASTDDFVAMVEKHAPGDWDWFFDQWVHGTEIPTYRWAWSTAEKDGQTLLVLDVEQRGVPRGFKMPVPVEIVFDKKRRGQIVVPIDEPHEKITIPIPQKPKDVVFNAGYGVLAKTEKM